MKSAWSSHSSSSLVLMDFYDEKAPNLRQSLLHNSRLVVNALLELRAIDETQQIWLVVCSHHLGQDSASTPAFCFRRSFVGRSRQVCIEWLWKRCLLLSYVCMMSKNSMDTKINDSAVQGPILFNCWRAQMHRF